MPYDLLPDQDLRSVWKFYQQMIEVTACKRINVEVTNLSGCCERQVANHFGDDAKLLVHVSLWKHYKRDELTN